MVFRSKEFWIAVVDAAVSLVTYFVAKYAAPGIAEDVGKVLLLLQPIILAIIGGFLAERVRVDVSRVLAEVRGFSRAQKSDCCK